jgi:hypothetical protein
MALLTKLEISIFLFYNSHDIFWFDTQGEYHDYH